ncbi:hypothetical protein ACJRO7_008890 [Eucalyptus globulus]|uniref:Uncharacterized protein n=1 Tax=Eucalyptus globulus TaxID=34317 RepID=A0ABD3IT48_EUCGL
MTPSPEEAWAKDKPTVVVLQTLQKGGVPPPGGPSYTPAPPRSIADSTDTRAFADQAMAPSPEEAWAKDKPSVVVLQTLQKGGVPPPGGPSYTPAPPRSIADSTDTRAFADQAMAPSPEEAWAKDKPSVVVLQTLQKGGVPPPGGPSYTPAPPRSIAESTDTKAFADQAMAPSPEEAWAKDKPSVVVLQTLQKGGVPPPGGPSYTPGPPRSIADSTDTRAFADQAMAPSPEEAWAKDKPSVVVLQTLQKGGVPPPGGPSYTPAPPRSIADSTNTRAFADQAMAPSPEEAWAKDKPSVVVLQTLQKGGVPPPGGPSYPPAPPRSIADSIETRAFADQAMAPSPEVNPVAFLSDGTIADRK